MQRGQVVGILRINRLIGRRGKAGFFTLNRSEFIKQNEMKLKRLPYDFTVCQVASVEDIDLGHEFSFIAKTDEELSLVCKTADTPENTTARDDGWKGFRIQGVLDFSLIGVLSKISGVLAESGIGIFAVSSFNTDYILVKANNFDKAMEALADAGYTVE